MTMRAHAALLVLALMLSPLASVVCELRCAPPPAAQPPTGHTPCHDTDSSREHSLRSQVRHCAGLHAASVTVGVEASSVPTVRDPQPHAMLIAEPGSLPAPRIADAPPDARPLTRTAISSPPLRI